MQYSEKEFGYYDNERCEILPFMPDRCRAVLDVGCGAGKFGALVKEQLGCEVWGVEPMEEAAEVAKMRLDEVIVAPFTPELPLPKRKFDVITFNDSLEHLPYPEPVLIACRDLLAPNGVVISSVPNVRYIDNISNLLIDMDWKYEKDGVLDYTHLRFFTKKSIVRTFENTGYYVKSIEGINPRSWLGWKYRLLLLLFRQYVADMRFLQFVVVAEVNNEFTKTGLSSISTAEI